MLITMLVDVACWLSTTDIDIDEVVDPLSPSSECGHNAGGVVYLLGPPRNEWKHINVSALALKSVTLKAYQTSDSVLIRLDNGGMSEESTSILTHVGIRCNHVASTQRALGRTCQ